MTREDTSGIRIGQMRILVSAVRGENYTVTANELHYSQPHVTKTIAVLEKTLGFKLFRNVQGRIKATPAARLLADRWDKLLEDFDGSVDSAFALDSGNEQIKLGLSNLGVEFPRLSKAIRAFQESGMAQIIPSSHSMLDMESKLVRGELDMAMVSGYRIRQFDPLRFGWIKVEDSCFAVFVPEGNPLHPSENLCVEDLRYQRFVVFSPEVDPLYDVPLKLVFEGAGFNPEIACFVPNEQSILANMRINGAVAIADDKTALDISGIKVFPFPNRPNGVVLVYARASLTAAREHFLNLVSAQK